MKRNKNPLYQTQIKVKRTIGKQLSAIGLVTGPLPAKQLSVTKLFVNSWHYRTPDDNCLLEPHSSNTSYVVLVVDSCQ